MSNRTEKTQVRVHIRWMIRRDMPEVLDAEQRSVQDPWTEDDFLRCLRQRNCIGMVTEIGEKVVGFMIYELHKKRLHILNFAVHPDYADKGIEEQLLAKLESKLSSHRRRCITIGDREMLYSRTERCADGEEKSIPVYTRALIGPMADFFLDQGFRGEKVVKSLLLPAHLGGIGYKILYRKMQNQAA